MNSFKFYTLKSHKDSCNRQFKRLAWWLVKWVRCRRGFCAIKIAFDGIVTFWRFASAFNLAFDGARLVAKMQKYRSDYTIMKWEKLTFRLFILSCNWSLATFNCCHYVCAGTIWSHIDCRQIWRRDCRHGHISQCTHRIQSICSKVSKIFACIQFVFMLIKLPCNGFK